MEEVTMQGSEDSPRRMLLPVQIALLGLSPSQICQRYEFEQRQSLRRAVKQCLKFSLSQEVSCLLVAQNKGCIQPQSLTQVALFLDF